MAFKKKKKSAKVPNNLFKKRYNRMVAALSSGRVIKEDGTRGRKLTKEERGRALGFIEGYDERSKIDRRSNSNINKRKRGYRR